MPLIKFGSYPPHMNVNGLLYLKVDVEKQNEDPTMATAVNFAQLLEYKPKTYQQQLVANRNGDPLLDVSEFGLKITPQEAEGLHNLLVCISARMERESGKSVVMDRVLEEVWRHSNVSYEPSKKVWGSWQYPLGDGGLYIKFGYYNTKEQGSVWGSFQLFKYDGWKCSGVGHKLKSWQVCDIPHIIISNGSQSD